MFIFVTEQTDLKRNGILSVNSAKQEMSFKQPCLFSNKSNSKTLQQNACLHENFSANVQKIKIDKKIGVENLQPLSHQNICMKTVQVRHKLSLKSLFKRRTYLYVCKVCIFFQKIVSNGIKNLTVLYNNGFNGFFEGKEEHVL